MTAELADLRLSCPLISALHAGLHGPRMLSLPQFPSRVASSLLTHPCMPLSTHERALIDSAVDERLNVLNWMMHERALVMIGVRYRDGSATDDLVDEVRSRLRMRLEERFPGQVLDRGEEIAVGSCRLNIRRTERSRMADLLITVGPTAADPPPERQPPGKQNPAQRRR